MHSIIELKNIKGKTVLMRVDFNEPIKNGRVESDFRIKKSLASINFLKRKGARQILISHLGQEQESLAPIAKILNKLVKIKFIQEISFQHLMQ